VLTYLGWFTKNGVKISQLTKVNADATFYAHWKPNKYKLKFNLSGGKLAKKFKKTKKGKKKIPALTLTYGAKYGTLPKLSRKGYKFKGWYTSKKGKIKVSAKTKMGAKNVTVYARWVRK
jgi:uncharacterized repeat protein (TIGR02543 family)